MSERSADERELKSERQAKTFQVELGKDERKSKIERQAKTREGLNEIKTNGNKS